MIITVDKEGYEALTQVLDIYIKSTGLQGQKLLNDISKSLRMTKEAPVKPDAMIKPSAKAPRPEFKKDKLEEAKVIQMESEYSKEPEAEKAK